MTARLKKTANIDEEVFAFLREAAASGAPCPSNRGVGRKVGVSEYAVSRSFSRLHARGLIVIRADSPFRRRVSVPGSGETGWSVAGGYSGGGARRFEQPMQLLAPADSPWTGNCFAAHDAVTKDDVGSVSRPATHVPTAGVLA